MLYWLPALIEEVKAEQAAVRAGEHGTGRAIYGLLLSKVNPETVAAIVISEALNSAMVTPEGIPLIMLNYSIGNSIVAEIHGAMLKAASREWKNADKDTRPPANEGDLWREVIKRSKNYKASNVNRVARKHRDELVQRRILIHLGAAVSSLLVNTASVPSKGGEPVASFSVTLMKPRGKKHRALWFMMEEQAQIIISEAHDYRSLLRPRYAPMLVDPYPWVPGQSGTLADGTQGGYARIRTPLTSNPRQVQKDAYMSAKMQPVLDALYKLGQTKWRSHPTILSKAASVWDRGGNSLGIPRANPADRPTIAPDTQCPELITAHKQRARQWYDAEVQRKSEAKTFSNRLGVAQQFEGKTIHFPHQFDFRGRVYSIPPFLNHQGPDICRGLLEFADPVEPGIRGKYWLLVHAASCYGIDKVSFDDRVQWSLDHLDEIVACSNTPDETDFWHHADKGDSPWQFLSACLSLTKPEHAARGRVQKDGTCNGLQHYSALTLDEDTAPMVNMVDSEKPADIYSNVMNIVAARMKEECPDLLQYLNRDIVKTPMMTNTYGVTLSGVRAQIMKVLEENHKLEADILFDTVSRITPIVWKAIKGVAPRIEDAMAWFRDIAKKTAQAGKTFQLVSPLGWPMVQPYYLPSKKRILTKCGEFRIDLYPRGGKVKVGKQTQSSAPNTVHMFDATHMMMTRNACPFRDFAANHDAFACHAANVDTMDRITREQWVELYKVDRMAEIYQYVSRTLGVHIDHPPERGRLDIRDVLQATYFFH